jgi:hypothetical protein
LNWVILTATDEGAPKLTVLANGSTDIVGDGTPLMLETATPPVPLPGSIENALAVCEVPPAVPLKVEFQTHVERVVQ